MENNSGHSSCPLRVTISGRKGQSVHSLLPVSEFVADVNTVLLQCYWKLNGQPPPATTTNSAYRAPCRTLDLLFVPISIVPQQRSSDKWSDKQIQHSVFGVNGVSKPDTIPWIGPGGE